MYFSEIVIRVWFIVQAEGSYWGSYRYTRRAQIRQILCNYAKIDEYYLYCDKLTEPSLVHTVYYVLLTWS